ncbi:MAG: YrhK family protein [Aphanocapsa lilacina HA4352-LM1]|jgi:hypothetical protein|nr:YrhK family protein [Aphanocapsa lilacina HA4352-LM1]
MRGYVQLPKGWFALEAKTLGPFVIRETFVRPDGRRLVWTSRRHRKRPTPLGRLESALWAPRRPAWWIAVLFMVGSALFATGSSVAPAAAAGGVFFAGSLFFTAAGYLQFFEAINAPPLLESTGKAQTPLRFVSWEPRRLDWWWTAIQLAGTVLFNINTFDGLLRRLTVGEQEFAIWTPDVAGSVCFLVSSLLAYQEVERALGSSPLRSSSWWVVALNLLGSIAFGVSAVAAFVLPGSGQPLNPVTDSLFTFIGATCFFGAALLSLPEGTSEQAV